MKVNVRVRGLLVRALVLLAVLAVLTVFINLSWFDEPLHPDLAALSTPQPVSMEGNAYTLIHGLPAADDRDPRAAGEAIVRALRERYRQGERIALSTDELNDILGGSNLDQAWQAEFQSLTCNARTSLDCADRLIVEAGQGHGDHPRLRLLLERYDAILRESRFEEIQEADVYSPVPGYGLLMTVGRMRLAMSYQRAPTAEFLAEVGEDSRFWRTMLRDGQSLIAKMVALAGLRNDLEFLSALMRERELNNDEIEVMRSVLQPLTRQEQDIGEAFLAELRIVQLSYKPLVVALGDSSWVTGLTLQENATLNEYYLTAIMPTLLRASLSADEFYRRHGYERPAYTLRAFPPPLFNLGGKLVLKTQTPGYQDYISRVHDLGGRMSLVLLQAEIEQSPEQPAHSVIQSSKHRNPYTLAPMEYDPQAQTIAFECLSNPNDVCGAAIGRSAR